VKPHSFRIGGLDRSFYRVETLVAISSIAIGVLLVATTLHLLRGIDLSLRTQLERIGSRTLFVTKFEQGVRLRQRSAEERLRPDLTVEHAERLRSRARTLVAVSPERSLWTAARHRGKEVSRVLLIGGTEDYLLAHDARPDQGRLLTRGEVQGRSRVCVVGPGVAKALFGDGPAVGETIEAEGGSFKIVGVVGARGSALFGRAVDHFVLIPIGALRYLGIPDRYTEFVIAVAPRSDVDAARATEEIRRILRDLRRRTPDQPDDFAITPQTGLLEIYRDTAGTALQGLVAVGAVSLFVGAMGILTVMLLTVLDRTAEIGLRRAVGARRLHIFLSFLREGAVMALAGGAVGAVLSALLVLLFGATTGLPISPSPGLLAWSVAAAVIVGLVASTLPAWRAAHLDPGAALRYE
jgi:putative ABC transport system permease protein